MNCVMQVFKLTNLLLEDFSVLRIKREGLLVPLLAHPALHSVDPVSALFNVLVPKNSREDDLVHVASHWILDEQIEGHLIDAHEHEGQFAS